MKSNYSDDKNQYIIYYTLDDQKIKKYPDLWKSTSVEYVYYRGGYLAGERDKAEELAFTEEEKYILEKLITLSKPCLDNGELTTMESLKKKVLGEQ